jgi:hypothetical protein
MPKKTKGGEEYKETQLKIDDIFFISSKEDNTGKTTKPATEKKPAQSKPKATKKKPTSEPESDGVQYFDPQTGEIQEG